MTQRHHHTMENHLTLDMVNDTAAPPHSMENHLTQDMANDTAAPPQWRIIDNGESLDTGHGQ